MIGWGEWAHIRWVSVDRQKTGSPVASSNAHEFPDVLLLFKQSVLRSRVGGRKEGENGVEATAIAEVEEQE